MEWWLIAAGAVAVIAVAQRIVLQPTGDRDSAQLVRLNRKLDLIADHLGVPAFAPLPDDVQTALRAGKKIEAIKRYRAATGAGLKEAKDAIEGIAGLHAIERTLDALLAHVGAAASYQPSEASLEAVRTGNTIEAIRRYRTDTGADLREAKAAIDAIANDPTARLTDRTSLR